VRIRNCAENFESLTILLPSAPTQGKIEEANKLPIIEELHEIVGRGLVMAEGIEKTMNATWSRMHTSDTKQAEIRR